MDNDVKCINCSRTIEECQKDCVGKAICWSCKMCKSCSKAMNKKAEKICKICCKKCKRCDKVLLKNNWPIDVIIGDLCNKCFHLCKKCGKYVPNHKAFYKENSGRLCGSCFTEKYHPSNNSKDDFKYTMLNKKEDYGKLFLGWRKTHQNKICESCLKEYWKPMNTKVNNCKKCRITSKNEKKLDPSSATISYALSKKGKEGKWIVESKKKICLNCYSPLWIKKENLDSHFYHCKDCPPKEDKQKLKYSKNKQRWIPYREKITCKRCQLEKWIFTKSKSDNGYCTKCKKIDI